MPPVESNTLGIGPGQRLPSLSEFFGIMNAEITERDGEWCGIPTPLPGLGLVLEDRHPYVDRIAELQKILDSDLKPGDTFGDPDDDVSDEDLADAKHWRVVNSWRGHTRNHIPGEVFVLSHDDGTTKHGFRPDVIRKNRMMFGAMETIDAWLVKTEETAMARLRELLTPRMFGAYVLTGQFLETSKRSGLTYLFRRLRPTIASTARPSRVFKDYDDGMRILCCLCLYPLAYYSSSFCGAMVPTDDVIAHLMLMRGDEAMFWRRANQHAPGTPESGL